jgi:hypothetical protein
LGGKGRSACKADKFTAICEPIVWKMWETRRLTTIWTFTACYRDSFIPLPYHEGAWGSGVVSPPFLTSSLEGDKWSSSPLDTLPLRKVSPVPIV